MEYSPGLNTSIDVIITSLNPTISIDLAQSLKLQPSIFVLLPYPVKDIPYL